MSSRLDQVIAPTTTNPLPPTGTSSPPLEHPQEQQQQQDSSPPEETPTPITVTPDPLSTLPSSPPQIYLNLLILETSLRSQYLALRARRRQNTFFLLLLALWIAYFSYALFLRPREDGRGVGGSVYWVVEMAEKMALMGGVVTGVLIWGTGQWERGVRWPRRWLGVANRGLRGMNTKIVVLRGPWWKEVWSYLAFVFPFPYEVFFPSSTTSAFHYVESTTSAPGGGEKGWKSRLYDDESHSHSDASTPGTSIVEEDIAPGGDYIKLLLLPKSFSPAFRENWDEYRTDYWEKENERRAALRRKLKEQRREHAKMAGGWLWWTRLLWGMKSLPMPISSTSTGKRPATPSSGSARRHSHSHSHSHSLHHFTHLRDPSTTSMKRRSTPLHQDRDATTTHSRTSSRSTTPNPLSDADDTPHNNNSSNNTSNNSPGGRRRGSSVTSTSGSERKRRNKSASSVSSGGGGGSGRAPSPLTKIEPVGQS
ncbi:uncharacterized protein BDCG_07520 [Blastomyces dermatitidis ER-3]|uniref:Spo7-like protein n=3 Tax=Blastomyces TaxID=229219 RepID=A0A179UGJ9_BLAGS|nr:uncharacterized protein BDBG_03205 [Blastomyces gilchristii SLH14081]XP_045278730.1 uncharacterized protein BDCG_07520 [Blastomyces dermatitidis ER-3]EEQ92400.1 hypothetical protein BDCG_07520 [Blastomyces dermatitidis ER-3]EGE85583.1 serine/arginine repetitive matrix protein 1 [Blastomyces dermatitidis ATCC 18188]OAT07104.1 hypothetical protein BDBG_03205 [Blastomyces gilchristii SLH14081]